MNFETFRDIFKIFTLTNFIQTDEKSELNFEDLSNLCVTCKFMNSLINNHYEYLFLQKFEFLKGIPKNDNWINFYRKTKNCKIPIFILKLIEFDVQPENDYIFISLFEEKVTLKVNLKAEYEIDCKNNSESYSISKTKFYDVMDKTFHFSWIKDAELIESYLEIRKNHRLSNYGNLELKEEFARKNEQITKIFGYLPTDFFLFSIVSNCRGFTNLINSLQVFKIPEDVKDSKIIRFNGFFNLDVITHRFLTKICEIKNVDSTFQNVYEILKDSYSSNKGLILEL